MSFLRNTWYVAGLPDEVSEKPLARTFLDTSVVIYRGESGTLAALDGACPHRFAPLGQGCVVGDAIQCPYHGLRFDQQGACVFMPTGGEPPPRAKLRSYPIVERHHLLWIWMGDAASADPALIPDYAYLGEAGFGWFDGYMYVRGNTSCWWTICSISPMRSSCTPCSNRMAGAAVTSRRSNNSAIIGLLF
jgi:phenylpropionate dioxygenase-like ring-hydroxylating dioxygenase large terminal subunit